MPGLVLDASVALSAVLPDEDSEAAEAALERVADEGAITPGLWRLEVGNVLQMACRRARMTAAQRDAALTRLARLPVATDSQTTARAWSDTLRLAERHGLTLYDAAYLELAVRRALPLASFDGDLRAAATAEGVPLVTRNP